MFVLHAAWFAGEIALWGEVPEGPTRAGSSRARAGSLPFDAGATRLLAALGSVAPSLDVDTGCTEERFLWAPTARGRALPSSTLLGEAALSPGPFTLKPHRVTTLALTARESVDLLAALPDEGPAAPGIVAGLDASFIARCVRMAAALVARQRAIPGVERRGSALRASWRPVPANRDAPVIAALVRAMPGSARALSRDRRRPPSDAPQSVVSRIVAAAVDALMREAVLPRLEALHAHGLHGPHERWLASLGDPDGYVDGEAPELDALESAVGQWQRPLLSGVAAPFRLCLRIEEPRGTSTAWSVSYLLQAADDPSLLIPAAGVWAGSATELAREGIDLREVLLASLGQAARLDDRIARSLEARLPEGYELDAAGALAFLERDAPLLDEAGFGVLLPSWWTGKATRSRLSVRARTRETRIGDGTGLGDVFEVDWELALGGAAISRAELERLGRQKAPLVRVRGQWVHVGQDEMKAALSLLRRGKGRLSVTDLIRMSLGAVPPALEGVPLAIDGVVAGGKLANLLDRLQGSVAFAELPAPPTLAGTLRPYQVRGYSWLAFLGGVGLGACLADDMGLGKTIQALALLLARREGGERRPALVVCPTSVVSNWAREAARFAPGLRAMVHHGAGRARDATLVAAASSAGLVVTSYALLWRDAATFSEVDWSAVILDEAQNVKNPETHAARAARALRADVRIAMTGTPVENHAGELWSIMEILNPGFLGPRDAFRRRVAQPIQGGDAEAADRLRRLTAPFILRRLKTDRSIIDDLPEKMEMKVYCTLTREQATLYAAVAADALGKIEEAEGISRRGLVLASLTRLKQVCNHPLQLLKDGSPVPGRSGKLERLCELLEEAIAIGDRSLVFTQFAEMGTILEGHLRERLQREVSFLHGGVPARVRTEMVARFQEQRDPAILILTLKAGGTGLNLTAASQVFHYDRWWNPAVEEQATDRAFRIGQLRRVQVRKLLCAGTLEEKIDAMIERKRAVATRVVGTGESFLTELSTAELRELMTLRADAVGD